MNSPVDYILFVIEHANFCPRVGLVPRAEFIKARKDWYDTLKRCAMEYGGFSQVLFKNYIFTNGRGNSEPSEWSHIIGDIMMYIENDHDRNRWGGKRDRLWIDGIITDLAKFQFNSNKIMKSLETTKLSDNVKIVESIWVIETHDGKLRDDPQFDTVEEFLASYFAQ